MLPRAVLALIAVVGLFASGCGTVSNVYKSQYPGMRLEPYGGVKEDLEKLREETADMNSQRHDPAETFLVVIDLPFSFLGDTLTLPLALVPLTPAPSPIKQSNVAAAATPTP